MVRITMMARGICTCGRLYLVFQPEVSEVAQKMKTVVGDDLDVFVCDVSEVKCSVCGQVISLPAPEMLDVDRRPDIAGFINLIEESECGEEDAGRIEPDDDVPSKPSDKNWTCT